jgi:DNA-binding transcriptional ArsR family regulator
MVNQIDQALTALAEPTRRQVVELLRERPRRAGEIADALKMSGPAMSRHLKVLRQTGLIEEKGVERDARVRIYRLRPEPFVALQAWLDEMQTFWSEQLGAFKAYAERAGEVNAVNTSDHSAGPSADARPEGQGENL